MDKEKITMKEAQSMKPVKSYNRGVDKKWKKIISTNSKTTFDVDGEKRLSFDISQADEANDFLVSEIYGVTQAQIDNMDVAVFDFLLEKIEESKSPPLK